MGLTLCVCPGERGTIVRIGGEIDVCVAEALEEGLLRIMRAHTTRLLLDLSGVTFLDCAGLRALIQTRRRAELRNGSVDLIGASAPVRRIIDLTGMADIFPVQKGQNGGERAMTGDDTWTSPAQAQ